MAHQLLRFSSCSSPANRMMMLSAQTRRRVLPHCVRVLSSSRDSSSNTATTTTTTATVILRQQQQQQQRIQQSIRFMATNVAAVDDDDVVTGADTDTEDSHDTDDSALPNTVNGADFDLDPVRVRKDIVLASQFNQGNKKWDPIFCRQAIDNYGKHLRHMSENNQNSEEMLNLVSSEVTCRALRALMRCNLKTTKLSNRVRGLEKLIGTIGHTVLTDKLSLQLLHANGMSGNVGRTIALLQLRKSREYPVHYNEYKWAVQSIASAALEMRTGRNVYQSEADVSRQAASTASPSMDNPTRFLDAILINMHQRGVQLSMDMATTMLEMYSCTGRSGKAVHFHYKVALSNKNDNNENSKAHVQMKWNAPAPYYKIPSEITKDQLLAMPGSSDRMTKHDFEVADAWSVPLTAAFSFLDSLQHGACGHEPLPSPPSIHLYNALLRACCYRGAMWRALKVLNETIPAAGLQPNRTSYLRVLDALGRVGDAKTMMELFEQLVHQQEQQEQQALNNVDASTTATPLLDRKIVESMVNGMLNTSNIAGAISFLQDVFNQYEMLPPYTTHLKVLEFALASGVPYEAKRHVYFLQQLWKWDPTNPCHSGALKQRVALAKHHPRLSKVALQEMFQYFGYELTEEDFLEEFRSTEEEE